jgi:DNA-binding protein HU-beta
VTKSDFIDAVAARSGLSKKDAGVALDAVLDSVKDALQKGDEVAFTGFGKFSVQARKPSQKVTIPASKVPKFSAGSQLKAAVKQ